MDHEMLRKHKLSGDFSKEIKRLLEYPEPLAMDGHPIREVWDAMKACFADYTVVDLDELMEKDVCENPWVSQFAHSVEGSSILATETLGPLLRATGGHAAPVRLLAASRVFYKGRSDAPEVENEASMLCVEQGADEQSMKTAIEQLANALLGSCEVRYTPTTLPSLDPCYRVEAKHQGEWKPFPGCGMLTKKALADLGFDPASCGGFAISAGLEHLACVRLGLSSAELLWQAPYITS